jgi:NAD(P)-dependent dehydrogenase (short-subunit alcohol dehydrogenase family)
MTRLKDKVAIITGAARGIGFACARRFVDEGAKVLIADIDEQEGARAAEKLGDAARFVRCDVGQSKDVSRLVTAAAKAFTGDIDILVNNAGICIGAEFLDLSEEQFDDILRVNLKGAFLVSQSVARKMVAQTKKRPGAIVNMASINSTVAIPQLVAYTASKGGILQLTRATALALAPYGIRVNAIGPGSIMTRMLNSAVKNQEHMRNVYSRTPLGRFGQPEEIASAAAFLASNDASYITGEIIYVDGGRLALNYTVPVDDEALK